jgi:hypothetical protein
LTLTESPLLLHHLVVEVDAGGFGMDLLGGMLYFDTLTMQSDSALTFTLRLVVPCTYRSVWLAHEKRGPAESRLPCRCWCERVQRFPWDECPKLAIQGYGASVHCHHDMVHASSLAFQRARGLR